KISGADTPFPSSNIRFDPPDIRIHSIKFIKAKNAILNIGDISRGESEGFFSVFPDPSGTVRKVPLFMEFNGIPYPSLALETLRVGLGEEGVTIHVSKKNHSIYKVSIGDRVIPTDEKGQVTVNFRGYVKQFPYVPAVEILKGRSLGRLRNKFVLIGTSAPGLRDLKATPFSSNFPGVEVHANVIDNLMAGDPMVYDSYTEIAMTYLFIIVGGISLCALLAFSTPLSQGLGWVLFFVATVAGSHFFFLHNSIVGITYPLVTI
ncbi:MAG: CHASE2 domain-containing protein, partial [Deltaproteobacteria bacterium]|nr:CHASE2 domain-containing protein [Deltaproteobacteria bacterium]